jgi:hypothetical protein
VSSTVEGRRLTDAQRRAQLALRAAAARDVLEVWRRMFDVSDIEGSWARMEPAIEAITRDYRRRSSGLAVGYYQAHRTAEGVAGSFRPSLEPQPSREALRYSLGFYGKVVPNQLLRAGRPDVMQQAGVHLVGGVSRHVNNGGRSTLEQAIIEDNQATGWMRVTGPDPCAFCAMLASRGPVFKTGQSALRVGRTMAPEQARHRAHAGFGRLRGTRARDESFHDHCQCTAEPQYIISDPWQERFPQAAEDRDLWDQAQREARDAGELRRGTSNDALNAFRRKYERG